jgi:aquaporin Z
MNFLPVLVEFLGTFIFLSVIVATGNPWAIGATLAILAFLAGSISGGHFNPAVTIMTLYNRGIASENAVAYIVAQIAAGILAVVVYNNLKKSGVF